MMQNNFYALVKEEPESISENEMDTNVVLPPTSCVMAGHTPPGVVTPAHVVGAPMPPGLPLTPVTPTSMQPPQLHPRLDIDPNFEPVVRSRSNTWPLPCPEGYIEGEPPSMVPTGDMPNPTGVPPGTPGQPGDPTGGPGPKKNTSRRNPWGNMSYADLIAQAILSTPDHRATLSQVYDWMVQNVPYFKDKGDSNSSAGWKNSIRHNLSLHNRFMRVQNEGTGKSSWWVLNPDAKPGKSTRRRANTMEGGRFEKKRGRVKKKMEALRNGLDTTPSPSSSISENLDLYPDSPLTHHPAFSQLSPQDFRPRASSNASSCGRLSPIPAIESDMHDAQVPPMSPGIGGWGPGDYWGHHGPPHHGHHLDRFTDQLVDSMGEGLKLGNGEWASRHPHPNPSDCMKLTQLSPHATHHPPGPPPLMNGFHPHHQHHPQAYGSYEDFLRFGPHNPHPPNYSLPPTPHQDKMHTPTRGPHPHSNYTLTNLQVRPQAMSPAHSAHSLSPTQPLGEGHYPGPGGEAHQPTSSFPSPPSSQPSPHSQVPPTSEASNMLRQALQQRDQQQQQQQQREREGQQHRDQQHRDQQQREAQQQRDSQQQETQQHREQQQQQHREQQQQQHQQRNQSGQREGSSTTSGSQREGSSSGGGSSSSTGPGGQPMQDFVDLDTIQGGLECNVEEVIKHELQMGGSLDFSFPQAHHHAAHHAHAHAHHHAHHQHMGVDHSRPQMPGHPAMPPYNCNSIAAGNHWVR